MRIIDFHTHAFPDALAERAVPAIEADANAKASLDGKLSSLLRSMDAAGIEISVVSSIATKPSHFDAILKWSKASRSDRLVFFPSVHPDDPDARDHIHAIAEEGFRGLKMHPYYQNYDLAEERLFPLYERMAECGLILLSHTGFDKAFARDRIADPERIVRVLDAFPDLVLVTSHIGAWEDWDEVERLMLGKAVYMDVSYSLPQIGAARARDVLTRHPKEYILFGTDSPWADQREAVEAVRALDLGAEREQALFRGNAARLLGLD